MSHFYNSRMDMCLIDEATGQQFKLEPSPEDLEQGNISYDPVEHSHLWTYISVGSTTYTNQPDLVDWDNEVEECNTLSMGHWPFGKPLSKVELLQREVMDCLDNLDSALGYEELVMDQEEAVLEDEDDDDDESDDEGYVTEEESDSEDDHINFGLIPMLMHIEL